ncbi:hypothetical protein BUALT_Bualt06G0118500 [Buddleja alternifolia]|uniref:Aminotransferase class V domain-containing protein n=1 Tax=Buddleja alternifolia TaxID=168488 RepID=A0AAV6XG89_9LAMI|nr:hypothetical protein BUALT_Bualt06G0118500 [Buddleja alternifolia]
MDSPELCLRGCYPTPALRTSEPEHIIAKMKTTSSACRHNFKTTTTTSFFPNTQFTNHESIPSLQESFAEFIRAYPKYLETSRIDKIRARDYYHLSLSNHVCLDYIGIGLLSQSQIKSANNFPSFDTTFKPVDLKAQLLNGGEESKLESATKKRIMDFLNISQNDYSLVFTTNRSSAFKLVAESYPFKCNRELLTVYDHESEALDAMIDTSEKRGARVMAAEFKWPRLRVHSAKLRKTIVRKTKNRGLFVFPLRSRMSGAGYSYQWMTLAQQHGWHVLLDACALGPKDMDSFALSLFRPDFLICSFYKVFGENPTGFGCLFVKKSTTPILEASSGSGIVSIKPAKNLLRFHEDSSGTDNELQQIVIKEENKKSEEIERSNIECNGLDQVDTLGLMLVNSRGRYLINWLVTAMMKLHHPNRLDNCALVTIYGPKVKFDRGSAMAFNIYDWKGEKVEPALVQKLADRNNISLGVGFLHNIWFPEEEKKGILEGNMKCKEMGRFRNRKGDYGITVVTIALTFLADFEDVYRLWAFVAQFLDADFVEKERWRYTSLNQKTVEV